MGYLLSVCILNTNTWIITWGIIGEVPEIMFYVHD